MRERFSARWNWCFALLLAFGLAACSSTSGGGGGGDDDDDDPDGGNPDTSRPDSSTGTDSGGGTPDSITLPDLAGSDSGGDFTCDELLPGDVANVGETCDPADTTSGFCGQRGACLELVEGSPQCYELCAPPQCTDCPTEQSCFTLVDQDQNPIPITDDTSGPFAGVCDATPVGDGGNYDPCPNGQGDCGVGLMCIGLRDVAAGSFCSPECVGGECPNHGDGTAGSCMLTMATGDPATQCALPCDTAAPACPSPMTCILLDAASQTAICMPPE